MLPIIYATAHSTNSTFKTVQNFPTAKIPTTPAILENPPKEQAHIKFSPIMPKRKRNSELTFHDKLQSHHEDIARALKSAKGFERQRLSKRLHDDSATPDKKERVEREIGVLRVRLRKSSPASYVFAFNRVFGGCHL